jgi:hypothetical protein
MVAKGRKQLPGVARYRVTLSTDPAVATELVQYNSLLLHQSVHKTMQETAPTAIYGGVMLAFD